MAKMLIKYSARHSGVHFSRTVIAQVPGSMSRSTAVHGVVESFFKSKKYIVPSAVVSPIFAGCVAGMYLTTGAGHFEPARNASIWVVGGQPEEPVDREDVKAYREQFKHYLADAYPEDSAPRLEKNWAKLQSRAETSLMPRVVRSCKCRLETRWFGLVLQPVTYYSRRSSRTCSPVD